MAEVTSPAQQRIIPGAPPPPPASKASKKKRKANKPKSSSDSAEGHVDIPDATSAALTEEAPKPEDIKEGHVAPQLAVQTSEAEPGTPLPGDQRASPAIDVINKKLKAHVKKLVCLILLTIPRLDIILISITATDTRVLHNSTRKTER